MAKLELNDIGTLANPASARQALNDNFKKIEDEFEKVLHRDGSVPNSMEADLDMDSHRILNVADAVSDKDAVNKGQVLEIARSVIGEAWQSEFDDLVGHVGEELSRALKLPPGMTNLSLPSPEPSHVIGWNETGTALRNWPPGELGGGGGDGGLQEEVDDLRDEVEGIRDDLSDLQDGLDDLQGGLDDQQARLDQEIADRIAGDLAEAAARTSALLEEANARKAEILAEANARADADAQLAADILAEAAARGTAINTVTELLESATESLAQQIAQVSAGTGEQFDPYIIWHFNSGTEGWNGSTDNGWLLPGGTDPAFYQSPDNLNLDSAAYRYVKLRIKRVGSPGAWRGWLRWITPTDTTWDTTKEVQIPEPVFDDDGIATIAFRDIGWTAEPVRRIRLYLASNPASWPDTYLIDWIAIGRPSPGASTAALQEERMARITGDAAEAAAREVLATQIRGSYTGNDISELTSGLLYSERVARSTGDAALASSLASEVTARETLQAQVNDPVTGLAATRARLINEESVRADADGALSSRLDVVSARLDDAQMVINGGFEGTTSGWSTSNANADARTFGLPSGFAITDESGVAASGSRGLRILPSSSADRTCFGWLLTPVTPGETIYGRFMGRITTAEGLLPDNGRAVRLGLRFYDASGTYINGSQAWVVSMTAAGSEVPYTEYSGSVVVPSNAAFVRVILRVAGTQTTGQFCVDDIVVQRMGPAQSAQADAMQLLDSRVTSVEGQISSQGSALTAVQAELANKASSSALSALDSRVTSVEGTLSSQGAALTAVQAELDSKASASALSTLETRVTSAEGELSSQATALTSLNTALGSQSATIAELMEITGSARLVDLRNPSFETNDGWAANTNGTGGLPSGVTYETATAHSGSRVLRFTGVSTVVHNVGRTPVRPGEKLRVGGWFRQIGTAPNSGARLRIGLRSYDASGAYISGSALVPVDIVMSGRGFTFPANPDTGIYTVPEGAASVGLYVQTSGLTSGSVAVDDVFMERITETENRFMASHTLALDVNGHISGMRNENDGETSSFSILANVFRVISGPTAGIEWQNGYLRAYALGAQIVLGSNFGSGNDLMLWCGPNIGADNCSKANGTFWVDNTGDGYFAGRVLQGVLRWFNSTTSTASNASVSTGSNPRLGKNVALAARYQYSELWTYLGGTVTPGPGNTAATIVIERRYGTGSWTTLVTRTIPGIAEAYNNPGSGDPSSWNVSISGEVFATDTASTSDSEYRARITSRSVQSHNPGTDGQPAVISQYLSIEAME